METHALADRRFQRLRHYAAATSRGIGHYLADNGPQYAAAISYKAIFSLIPLLTFAVTVAGVVLQDDKRRQEVIDFLVERLSFSTEATADLDRILTSIPSPWSLLGLVSILIVLWSASGVMGSIRIALTVASDTPPEGSFARRKLIDFALVVAVTIFVLLAVVLNLIGRTLSRWTDDIFAEIKASWLTPLVESVVYSFAVPALLLVGVTIFVYWFVPPRRAPMRYLLIGGLLAGIALQVIQLALAWWLTWSASDDVVSGVIGGVVGFLLTVYISANAFLVGGELIYAWAGRDTPSKDGQPSLFQSLAARIEGG